VNYWLELTVTVAEEGLIVTLEAAGLTVTATLLETDAPLEFLMRALIV